MFIIALLTTQLLHATEPKQQALLPIKLISEALYAADLRAKNYFHEKIHQKKVQVEDVLSCFMPPELIRIIERYRSPYTDHCQNVIIGNDLHPYTNTTFQGAAPVLYLKRPQILSLNTYISVLIPIRYPITGENGNVMLNYEDIFKVYMKALNQPSNISIWNNYFSTIGYEKECKENLSKSLMVSELSQPPVLIDENDFITKSPVLLIIYWNNEAIPLLHRASSVCSFLDEECYQALQKHNKLSCTTHKGNLIMFCMVCNGRLHNPSEPLWSYYQVSKLSEVSEYCTRKNSRCRAKLMGLRIFQGSRKRKR